MGAAKGHVLVVDDDADIREILSEILEEEGYRVTLAVDGAAALDRLRDGVRPDLILLDLMMPRCSGWEFRARQVVDVAIAAIPVVVLSADHGARERVNQLGVAGFVAKPVDLDRLLDIVRLQLPPAIG